MRTKGFTLVEVAMVLSIGGLMMAGAASMFHNYQEQVRFKVTQQRLKDIQAALSSYVKVNNALPCPAQMTVPPENVRYGRQITDTSAYPGGDDCVLALGTPAMAGIWQNTGATPGFVPTPLPTPTPANRYVIGAVPVRTLNLTDQDMVDGYGNRIVYAVSNLLTRQGSYDIRSGAIRVRGPAGNELVGPSPVSDTNGYAQFVLASLGKNQRGAYGLGGTQRACWPNTGVATPIERQNCLTTGQTAFVQTLSFSTASGAPTYDDKLVYVAGTTLTGDVDDAIWKRNAGTGEVFLKNGGDEVGIGTDTPAAKLHVAGNALVTGTTPPAGDLTSTRWLAGNGTGGNYGGGWFMSDTSWIKAVNNKAVYTGGEIRAGGNIDTTGNIGAGTNAPTSPLHVVGNALITGNATIATNAVISASGGQAYFGNGAAATNKGLWVNANGETGIKKSAVAGRALNVGGDTVVEGSLIVDDDISGGAGYRFQATRYDGWGAGIGLVSANGTAMHLINSNNAFLIYKGGSITDAIASFGQTRVTFKTNDTTPDTIAELEKTADGATLSLSSGRTIAMLTGNCRDSGPWLDELADTAYGGHECYKLRTRNGSGGATFSVTSLNSGDFTGYTGGYTPGVHPLRIYKNNTIATLINDIIGTVRTTSDRRLKAGIETEASALARVLRMRPVTFEWKKDPGHRVHGFIADEMEKILPDAVSGKAGATGEEGRPVYQAIDYSQITAITVKAIQEQQAENEKLRADLKALHEQVEALQGWW